jgi:spore germination protein KC
MGLLTGCGTGLELDSEIYPIMLGYDSGETEKYKVTMKFMKPDDPDSGGPMQKGAGESKEEIPDDVMVMEAPTFIEAINMANAIMPKRISLLHVKMLVISEELAQNGVATFIESLARYNEIKPTMSLVISKSTAYELITAEDAALTDSLQMDMELIMESNNEVLPYTQVSLAQFLYHYDTTFGDAVAMYGNVNQSEYESDQEEGDTPSGKISRTKSTFKDGFLAGELPVSGKNKMELAGMSVFRDDKMVGTLNTNECLVLAFLNDAFHTVMVTYPDLYAPDEYYVSLKIRRAKPVKINTYIDGDGVTHADIQISVNGVVGLSQNPDVDYLSSPQQRNELQDYASRIMEQQSRTLIERLQSELKSDVLQLGRRVSANFATIQEWEAYDWRAQFENAEINVSYQINL